MYYYKHTSEHISQTVANDTKKTKTQLTTPLQKKRQTTACKKHTSSTQKAKE